MDEQENKVAEKQVPKKPSLAKNIFKWLFVTLLAVLLISAIIFHAPWKVLTLLVIFLVACTVLPRAFRKWFWLSVGVVVIVLIVWVFLPDDSEGWRPYTFDEELAALEAKYAIPDEENAAIIYNRLLENYDKNAFYTNLPNDERQKLPMREPWLSKDHPQIAEWVQQHQATIATLMEASKIEKCQFPISVDTKPDTSSKMMKRLPRMKSLAYLSISAANNDIAENRIDQALKKYLTVLQMGTHMRQQPTSMGLLVGLGIEGFAANALKGFIVTTNPTKEHLDTIEKALAGIEHDWSADFRKFLEHDKLLSKNFICGILYEMNAQGRIRLNRDPGAQRRSLSESIFRWSGKEVDLSPNYFQRKVIKAKVALRWFWLPTNPQKIGALVDSTFERLYAMAEPTFQWEKETAPTKSAEPAAKAAAIASMSDVTSLYATPVIFDCRARVELEANTSRRSYYRLHDIYLRIMAEQTGTQIITALTRYKNKHGNWPQSLDDITELTPPQNLIDPMNNASFVYKVTDDGFALYSKGKNNVDEDGKRDPRPGADDWLIWPPKHHKKEKDNSNAE